MIDPQCAECKFYREKIEKVSLPDVSRMFIESVFGEKVIEKEFAHFLREGITDTVHLEIEVNIWDRVEKVELYNVKLSFGWGA